MFDCPRCGRGRDPSAACAHCGDAVTAQAAWHSGAAPFARKEALERWDAALDASPVFADTAKPKPATPPTAPAFRAPLELEPKAPVKPKPILGTTTSNAPAFLDVAIDARFDVDSACADGDPAVDLLVTMTPMGTPLLRPSKGPIAHVVLALDVSASMNDPAKYPMLCRALVGMLDDLHRRDSTPVLLSVVVFAYGAQTLFRAVPAKELSARRLLDALDSCPLRFGRYSDVAGALSRAGRIAYDSIKSNKAMPVRICLLTDGRPQDVPAAHAMMSLIHKLPVDVDGIGFGDDADVPCLKTLVVGGRGGTVKHVRAETIGEAFGRIGESAQRVIAPRALLELELRGGVIGGLAYRFRPARHRYGNHAFDMGKRFVKDLGTLESGRTCSLLFQIRLPVARGSETEVGRLTLRVPGFGGPRVFEKSVSIARHVGGPLVEKDPEVVAARDVLEALDNDDPAATLRALQTRRQIYEREQRDPHVLVVIDRAIDELQRHGSLAALSAADHSTLVSHTLTRRMSSRRPAAKAAPLAS
jgi:hypothetical protein